MTFERKSGKKTVEKIECFLKLPRSDARTVRPYMATSAILSYNTADVPPQQPHS